MKKYKLERLESLDVQIVKMEESSGNEQFFVNLVRNDVDQNIAFAQILKTMTLACFQTKKNGIIIDKNECLSLAWFEAGRLARFAGLKSLSEIKLVGFSEEEQKVMFDAHTIFIE